MSRSFTVKPSVSYSQGRGRGTQLLSNQANPTAVGRGRARGGVTTRTDRQTTRHTQTGMNREQGQLGDGSPAQQQQPGGGATGLDQRMSYQGGFTMIAPNERRRQEVSTQARQEEEAYQRHKENNRLGHVSYVGTAGGGQKTQAEVRSQQVQTQQASKYNSIQKRQAARDVVKKREEEEILKKKTEQRRKTEQNQRTEEDRQRKLQEDHRQKNEAFLRRLESEQKSKAKSKPKPAPACTEPDELSERNEAVGSLLDVGNSQLRELQRMFPMYDRETLGDILSQAGSVEAAADLLSTEGY